MTYKLYSIDNEFIKEVEVCPENFTGIIKFPKGNEIWHLNGKRHRINGPAYIGSNVQAYWFKNKRHRIGGAARIYPNGTQEYWIDNKQITKEEHDLLCDIMKLKSLI